MSIDNDTVRSDEQIQNAVKVQFTGIAPERRTEFERLWAQYDLLFSLLSDGMAPVMHAGLYRYVQFNHRALRVLWVSSFAAWEGYSTYHAALEGGGQPQTDRLKELLNCALQIRDSSDPLSVSLPGIPEPGVFPDGKAHPQLRAASECAVFVSGWAMLHEIRHTMNQQDGTSTSHGTDDEQRSEEASCDLFATDFILERINDYVRCSGEDAQTVSRKRKIGIYFALFGLTVLAYPSWQQSGSHPAVQDRINAICARLQEHGGDEAMAIAACAFESLSVVWPQAPTLPTSDVNVDV